MPLIHTIQAKGGAKIAIWHITEEEEFFKRKVDVERVVHHPHKRLQHLAARYLLMELEPCFPIRSIRIAPSRKPYLPDNLFYFSLAHCGDYAAAILSPDNPVGIDIELITSKIVKLAHKFLDPGELAFISPGQFEPHLTVCWSAKEAIVKWYGGLGVDFREHIRLAPFSPQAEGTIQASFLKDSLAAELRLNYLLLPIYNVTWLEDLPGNTRP